MGADSHKTLTKILAKGKYLITINETLLRYQSPHLLLTVQLYVALSNYSLHSCGLRSILEAGRGSCTQCTAVTVREPQEVKQDAKRWSYLRERQEPGYSLHYPPIP